MVVRMTKSKYVFISVLTVIFVFGDIRFARSYQEEIKILSTDIAGSIAKAGRKMVAVVDFTDLQGNVTELGRFLAEEFSVTLAGAGRGFEVVDRVHLRTILAESKLSATGLIDPRTAQKLGQIAGVEALITGTITPFGDSVRLSVKVLDTGTARVIAGYSGNIAKTKAIEELLARGVEPLGVSSPLSPGTTTLRATAKYQDFPKFRVEVEALRIGGDGTVTVFLAYINKTREELLVGRYGDPNTTFVVDSAGNQYPFQSSSGMDDVRYRDRYPLTIGPSMRATASFTLRNYGGRLEIGKAFSFTSQQAMVTKTPDGLYRPLSIHNISITNIPPGNP